METIEMCLSTIKKEIEARDKKIARLQKENAELKETIQVLNAVPKRYSVEEIAKLYNVSKASIYKAIKNKVIQADTFLTSAGASKGRLFVRDSELEKLFKL